MDDEPSYPATDAVKPWTIKSIASEARDLAIMAARREQLTVGQWLERLIRQATAGEFVADRQGAPLSGGQLVHVGSKTAPRSDHEELDDLARMARSLTPPDKDSAAMRLARSLVVDRLKGLKERAECASTADSGGEHSAPSVSASNPSAPRLGAAKPPVPLIT